MGCGTWLPLLIIPCVLVSYLASFLFSYSSPSLLSSLVLTCVGGQVFGRRSVIKKRRTMLDFVNCSRNFHAVYIIASGFWGWCMHIRMQIDIITRYLSHLLASFLENFKETKQLCDLCLYEYWEPDSGFPAQAFYIHLYIFLIYIFF